MHKLQQQINWVLPTSLPRGLPDSVNLNFIFDLRQSEKSLNPARVESRQGIKLMKAATKIVSFCKYLLLSPLASFS